MFRGLSLQQLCARASNEALSSTLCGPATSCQPAAAPCCGPAARRWGLALRRLHLAAPQQLRTWPSAAADVDSAQQPEGGSGGGGGELGGGPGGGSGGRWGHSGRGGEDGSGSSWGNHWEGSAVLLCMGSGVLISLIAQAAGKTAAQPTKVLTTSCGCAPAGVPAPAGSSSSRRAGASAPAASISSSAGNSGSSQGAVSPSTISVSIIVPALDEAKRIEASVRYLLSLSPAPKEVIVVDGGSADGTVAAAKRAGARVVRNGRGRARQMNAGAEAATGDILVFVHADSQPPAELVRAVRAALARPRVVLGGFTTLMDRPDGRGLLLFHTFHHFVKAYYPVLLLRPLSLVRGLRCLFGDQNLFCRSADFKRVGGYDARLPLMEDADLCIRMHMAGPAGGLRGRGRVVQLLRPVSHTSGRRLGVWGNLLGTWICARISVAWYFGASPERLKQLYDKLWTDKFR